MDSGLVTRADAAQFRELFGRTSQVDKTLLTFLRKAIKAEAEPTAAAVRRTVRQQGLTQAKNPRPSQGLRQGIADGVAVKLMTGANPGVTIEVTAAGLPASKKSLVFAWESLKGWRHPVFARDAGERDVRTRGARSRLRSGASNPDDSWRWVHQMGRPYFRQTVFGRRNQFRAAVEDAMQQAAATIVKGP